MRLKSSRLGDTVARPNRKFFDALISSWLIRSATFTTYGTSATVSVVTVNDGPMPTAPAGHGAGQFAGYLVVAPTANDAELGGVVVEPGAVPIATPRLLWSAPLGGVPYAAGAER